MLAATRDPATLLPARCTTSQARQYALRPLPAQHHKLV